VISHICHTFHWSDQFMSTLCRHHQSHYSVDGTIVSHRAPMWYVPDYGSFPKRHPCSSTRVTMAHLNGYHHTPSRGLPPCRRPCKK
jgi:hypothetical protein